jgi:peptidoglycan/xylan/chitin deacetylase (PgdA/CDA1 family)
VSEVTPAALRGQLAEGTALPAGRWRPAPANRASFALHVFGACALLLELSWWPWVLGVLAANHLLLSLAVLFPRAAVLGPNLTRLPAAAAARGEVALTFDDGPDPAITPRVLDLLDQYGMRASFFLIAENALAHPELTREIVRRGHQVENHSFHHHATFSLYGYARLGREVDAAQQTLAHLTERAPRFFRAPAGFRNPFLDPVLARRGLRYVSWTRRGFDAVASDPRSVLARLRRGLAAGDILLLHDGSRARTAQGEPVALAVLPLLLEALRAAGLKSVPLASACQETPN